MTGSSQPGRRGRRGRRRAARNASAFALAGILGLIGVAAALARTEVPNPAAEAPTIAVTGDVAAITWVGDTLLGDGAQPFIDEHGPDWTGALLPEFDPQSVVIANLEGPITTRTEAFDPLQRWSYNSDPAAAAALAAFGIDAVSLANNHAMDRGPEGLQDTLANTQAAGIASFGAGADLNEAGVPLLIQSGTATIAVIGFSDHSGLDAAEVDRPGMHRLNSANLRLSIRNARAAGADRVVAAVHWGSNYAEVEPRQRSWAEEFAAAGYDLVVGTGPHIVQPIELVADMPVAYSLGNYVFGTPGRFSDDAPGFGLVMTTAFGGDTVEVTVRCIETDNELVGYQPRSCETEQASLVLKAVSPDLTIVGEAATVTLPLPAGSG